MTTITRPYIVYLDRPAWPWRPMGYVRAERVVGSVETSFDGLPASVIKTRIVVAANAKDAIRRSGFTTKD